MALIYKANEDNYLAWEKVVGTLSLAELQQYGLPTRTARPVESTMGDYNDDYNSDYKIT